MTQGLAAQKSEAEKMLALQLLNFVLEPKICRLSSRPPIISYNNL